ncbi:MAG TPA: ATP-binding protein [Phycisphaerae bacterium]|nr:ATP-binding protein [Phycisphaerales bacterium]HRX83966.1 ATP-binding protein [Phycisphaerae bacterium]
MNVVDPHNEATYRVIEIPSTLADAKKPEVHILAEVERCGYDEDSSFAIKLALEEAMTNAVRHGNSGDATKHVTVRYAVTPEMCVICVRDEGPGFVPGEIPDPTAPDRLSLPCGRGIMLMKAYMTDVEYRANGREVRMVKRNPQYRPKQSTRRK